MKIPPRTTTQSGGGDDAMRKDHAQSGHVSASGVYPHLAVVADHVPRSESGVGALMPWAHRLWLVSYVSHGRATGSGTGLFDIDESMTLRKHPASVVGTFANRMIHTESNQLIIGPHLIDISGKVRTADVLCGHRIAATMRHLSEPERKVYVLTMEGLFLELDVDSLSVETLFDLTKELGLPQQVRPHFKSGFTMHGRVVVANNSYDEPSFQGTLHAGRLAEWNGGAWEVVERSPFTEVYGERNLSGALFALGWDRASAILKVFVRDQWTTYRLPKGGHAYDHAWCTEWTRLREVETERLLMDCHGMFYEVPYHLYGGKLWGVRPISSHLRMVPDFCSWRGLLVLAGNQVTPISDSNLLAGQPQSGLWFGKTDDLWGFGKPQGWGGPWWETPVQAQVPSDPYLMAGFDKKVLHLYHDGRKPIEFKVEVDFLGDQTWKIYQVSQVAAEEYVHHEFPHGFSAHWVRVTADTECRATAYFTYT